MHSSPGKHVIQHGGFTPQSARGVRAEPRHLPLGSKFRLDFVPESSISVVMYSTAINPNKLNISLEVLNSLLISLLEETHNMVIIRKEGSDPATDVYMPIARNMADAQQVAHIISILLNMAGVLE